MRLALTLTAKAWKVFIHMQVVQVCYASGSGKNFGPRINLSLLTNTQQ